MDMSKVCHICEEITTKLALCNSCKNYFCKKCSILSVKEFNFASSNLCKLKFTCSECEKKEENFISQDIFPSQESISSRIYLNTSCNGDPRYILQSEFKEEIGNLLKIIKILKEEITNLKDSNIDLVRFLSSDEYIRIATNNGEKYTSKYYIPVKSKSNNYILSQNSNIVPNVLPSKDLINDKISNHYIKPNCLPNQPTHLEKVEPINTNTTTKHTNNIEKLDKNIIYNNKIKNKSIWGSRKTSLISSANKFWLFTSGYDKSTSEVDVVNYLKSYKPLNYECKKILTKNPNTSSFKVGIPYQYMDEFLQENVWPLGIYVNKFYPPRRQQTTENMENKKN